MRPPGNALAFNNLGAINLQIGNYREATTNFQKSMALSPNGMAAANISVALRSAGKYRDALPSALKSVDLDPTNDQNWLELGDCYSSLGTYHKEATAAYSRAAKETERRLAVDSSDGPSWMLLALYQVKSGDTRNALLYITKAQAIGADDIDSQLTKARILELLGKRDEALETISACFRRGATSYQLAAVPDLRLLQKDPRYIELMHKTQLKTA